VVEARVAVKRRFGNWPIHKLRLMHRSGPGGYGAVRDILTHRTAPRPTSGLCVSAITVCDHHAFHSLSICCFATVNARAFVPYGINGQGAWMR
jgi:hypothetical protein